MAVATSVWTLVGNASSGPASSFLGYTQVPSSAFYLYAGDNAPILITGAISADSNPTGVGQNSLLFCDFRLNLDGNPGPPSSLVIGPTGADRHALPIQMMGQATAAGMHTAWVEYRIYTGRRGIRVGGNVMAVSLEGSQGVTGPAGAIGPVGFTGPQGATGPSVGTFVGSGTFQVGVGAPLVEAALLSDREYWALGVRTQLSEVHVPTGTGDGVGYIGNAVSGPIRPPTGGVIMWSIGSSAALYGIGGNGSITTVIPAHREGERSIERVLGLARKRGDT